MLNLNFKRVNKTRPHGGYVPDSFMNHQKVKKKKTKNPETMNVESPIKTKGLIYLNDKAF